MMVEYEAVAIGAASIAAVLIWSKIRIWRRMRAIDTQLAKMQREIDVLQIQESRRLMMELKASAKADAPSINPDNEPVEVAGGDVVRLMKTPPTTPGR